jgi:hypothetical protein
MTRLSLKSHAELVAMGQSWLRRKGCSPIVIERKCVHFREISDAIGWKNNWKLKTLDTYLLECKATRSDFLHDRRKPHRSDGEGIGRYRYYLANDGVADGELPAKWGLLVISGRGIKEVVNVK